MPLPSTPLITCHYHSSRLAGGGGFTAVAAGRNLSPPALSLPPLLPSPQPTPCVLLVRPSLDSIHPVSLRHLLLGEENGKLCQSHGAEVDKLMTPM